MKPLLHKILYPGYDEKCKQLTKEDEIRFAAIIDKDGRIVAGGFKKGIIPLEKDKLRLEEFMEFAYEISQRKSFDESLGPINYIAARRDKIVLISFPLTDLTLLISADHTLDIEKLASHVVNVFDSEQSRFSDGT
ncbi:hypothetical protein QVH35_01745 [Candidatus Nitrosotenuis chungbukensis]|uniref:DUF6659 family protein n=1 Tax=Candidatus Nitrosotenuis chungbukensis TaxID=1353246 RepID=UPI000694E264|nr:DUF6659 family protein [Candidatus Nitrosotenuis chungbukensis]WKT58229.1 hypothetical protein QVH35_01745 [Candidatus Nitrosotenuis chungbukensis]